MSHPIPSTSHPAHIRHRRTWHKPMLARSQHEVHRASTPLELLFDLIFVVAISLNAAGLHHAIAADHVGSGLLSYAMQFSVVWWAWMGFTWFASSFDTDDVSYRLLVLVQMVGALVIAAGIPAAFERFDFTAITIGYILLRVGLVSLWLRAARANPSLRATAHRYAMGLVFGQCLWVSLLFFPPQWKLPLFALFFVYELCVPIWAELAGQTNPHAEHISERYGLFTIIVLGESVLAIVNSIKTTLETAALGLDAVLLLISAMLIIFSLWWLYFDKPKNQHESNSLTHWFLWGYGHYFVFASAAAIGVGVAVAVEWLNASRVAVGGATISQTQAQLALAVPVAAFLLSVWLVHSREINTSSVARVGFPLCTALAVASAWLPGIVATALCVAVSTSGLMAALLYQNYDAQSNKAHG